ncbi:DNA recombinase [Microbacterium phage Eleri]|uniref:DNA recombinase n=1 Tax=Microbacterium phage Eleri TaxID=2079581 RepID=A0A2L0HNT3_9CAUD|nr:DNA recombinase [Microbacterium phage Eleri]AUX83370.1 DNA recombinase [Microbacterium phage Eleri]
MDIKPLDLMRKVWRHAGVSGNVWMPHIANIGVKDKERFREGASLNARKPEVPELTDSVDWYWTPAVSHGETRRIKKGTSGSNYPAQRVVWVDCDDSYNDKLLESLRPSYMWETSPGHKQAIWLLSEPLPASEFHRDGFIGMLTQALGADKSGVDIGQLLRVPGTWHHKREPFQGRILRSAGTVYTRGQLLSRVAKGLGFKAGLASELGADDPYGDRSKVLWRFARNASELGLPQDLAFKLIKATKWNKWADDPERLKEDIGRAYEAEPTKPTERDPERQQAQEEHDSHETPEVEAWKLATPGAFGPIVRKPMKWVVPGIIPEAGVGLLVAAPKVGKTRVAIEMVLGLATGRRPLGIGLRRPVSVGFLSLEDGEYLFADRLRKSLDVDNGRYKYHWDGHIKPDLTWEPPVPMSLFTHFSTADLSTPEDKQRLYETIEKYKLKLVIIDTLSMAIGDHNVSDQKEMNSILKDVRTIARATGCAIMFIHHTRKRVFEKGESIQETILGATALHAWCEFVLSLASPEEDSDFLRLGVQTKMGNDQHYLNDKLKIIKKPAPEEITS